VVALALGVLTWSLLEYVLHRWLGHERRLQPNPFAAEHVRHHVEGDYFAPASRKAAAAVGVTLALLGPALALAGAAAGIAYVAGFVGAYVGYEVFHRRLHTHAGALPFTRWLRRHHFHHHFVDPRSNHGVTSPLWDRVFGTWQAPGRTRVPRRLAMRWLVDPATGQVRPEHADHYEIAAPREPA